MKMYEICLDKKDEKDPLTSANSRKRKRQVLPVQLTQLTKSKQVKEVKKVELKPKKKLYTGRYGDLLKEADNLEEHALQQLAQAKTKKKSKGVREAMVLLRATKRWLEGYND